MPGQYMDDGEVQPDRLVKLVRVGPEVAIVRRHGSSNRRVCLIGSDGADKHYQVQTSLNSSARSDERLLRLMRLLNKLLEGHKEARRRHLTFHTPVIVPIWPQVRLPSSLAATPGQRDWKSLCHTLRGPRARKVRRPPAHRAGTRV